MTDFRSAIYTRVSTDAQATEDKDSFSHQLERCRQLAEGRGYAVITEYREEGVSGSRMDRPELARMLADAAAGTFNILLIDNHDRLALSLGGQLTAEHGIGATRRQYLPLAVGDTQVEIMRRIKAAFDPHNILNPGKILP